MGAPNLLYNGRMQRRYVTGDELDPSTLANRRAVLICHDLSDSQMRVLLALNKIRLRLKVANRTSVRHKQHPHHGDVRICIAQVTSFLLAIQIASVSIKLLKRPFVSLARRIGASTQHNLPLCDYTVMDDGYTLDPIKFHR